MENQRKIVLFIAQSLDGYIATKEDSLDWLFKVGDYQLDLSLIGTRTFNQFVELHYKVKK